jgi:outer membrane receptor protein involved in Fe transport
MMAQAATEQKRSYDLPSGDAAKTLNQFAEASGQHIIFMMDKVRGERTNAVSGVYTAGDALARMLVGTGLCAKRDSTSGAFVVSRKRTSGSPPCGAEVGPASDPQPKPNTMKSRSLMSAIAGWLALGAGASDAQTTGPTPPYTDEVVQLTPFEVNTSKDVGYAVTNTLSGTRLNTSLRDLGASVTDITATFLEDIAASNFKDTLNYIPNFSQNIGGIASDPIANSSLFGENYRVRGFASGALSQDFLPTRAGGDNYNIERFSFSRGPNSLLFGIANAGGAINFVTKRAGYTPFVRTSFRFDDRESNRQELDVNYPLIKNQLAIRVALMHDDDRSHIEPGYKKSERAYAAMTYQPFRGTTLRANYEKGHVDEIVVRPWTVTDYFSEWVAAGRPLYDPRSGGPVPSTLVDLNTSPHYYVFLSPGGAGGSNLPAGVNFTDNYASRVPPVTQTGSNAFRQVNNGDYFPILRNPYGRGQSGDHDFDSYTFFWEQQIGEKLFIESVYYHTNYFRAMDNSIRCFGPLLRGDGSTHLRQSDGSFIPNPNAGKLYWDETESSLWPTHSDDEVMRLTASYELDFTPRSRWLGKNQLATLLERQNMHLNRETYSLINLSRPNAAAPFTNLDNRIAIRTYVEPSGNTAGSVTEILPGIPYVDATNYRNVPVTGNFTPTWGLGGASSAPTPLNTLTRIDSKQLMVQSRWLEDLFVTTLGWRNDRQRSWSANPRSVTLDSSNLRTRIIHLDPKSADPDGVEHIEDYTLTRGVVVNPFPWLAVFYNESTNFAPRNVNVVTVYGDPTFPNPSGNGKD